MLPSMNVPSSASTGLRAGAGEICVLLVFLMGGSVFLSSVPVLIEVLRWIGCAVLMGLGVMSIQGRAVPRGAALGVAGLTLALLPGLAGPSPAAMGVFVLLSLGALVILAVPAIERRMQAAGWRMPLPAAALGIASVAAGVVLAAS